MFGIVDRQFENLCAVDCQGCGFIVRRCDYCPPNISFGAFINYAVGCRLVHGADRSGRVERGMCLVGTHMISDLVGSNTMSYT